MNQHKQLHAPIYYMFASPSVVVLLAAYKVSNFGLGIM